MVWIIGRRPMEEGGPRRWEEERQTKAEKNLRFLTFQLLLFSFPIPNFAFKSLCPLPHALHSLIRC